MLKKLFLFFLLPSTGRAQEMIVCNKNCEDKLVRLSDSCTKSIDISVYSISNKRLVNAVPAAHKRGAKVRVLTNRKQPTNENSLVWRLWLAGIPTKVQTVRNLMHAKVAIYNGKSVSSSSMNSFMKIRKPAISLSTCRNTPDSIPGCSTRGGKKVPNRNQINGLKVK